MRKKGAENNIHEAGRRAVASDYRGAARLAWFMPGSRVGINHDRRALSVFPGSVVNFQSRERNGSVWAGRPRGGNGSRSGQNKKRSGAADLVIQQGSFNGGAKSCRFGGLVFQGEAKAGKSSRQGGQWGQTQSLRQPPFQSCLMVGLRFLAIVP